MRHEFSVPVKKISSNRLIRQHEYTGDFSRFLHLIENAYKKAPYFDQIMPVIESVVLDDEDNVARKNAKSITAVFSYLGLEREYLLSSNISLDGNEKGQDRILALCQKLKITQYRNAIGGQQLYDIPTFNSAGIELKFIKSNIQSYPQGITPFVPHLSIIDVLMHCSKDVVMHHLTEYSLI